MLDAAARFADARPDDAERGALFQARRRRRRRGARRRRKDDGLRRRRDAPFRRAEGACSTSSPIRRRPTCRGRIPKFAEPRRRLRPSRAGQGMVGDRRRGDEPRETRHERAAARYSAPCGAPGAASDPDSLRLGLRQRRLGQDPCADAARAAPAARRRDAVADPLPHLHQGRRRQHGGARLRDARRVDDASTTRSLREAIVETGAPRRAPALAFARRLFARTIETPGGLKIQTIHAFCERLLHLFPFEANVPAGLQRRSTSARRRR